MMSTRRQRKLRKSVSDGLYQSFNLPVLDWSRLVVQSGEIRVTTGWTKWDDHHSVLKVHLIKQVWHFFAEKRAVSKSMLLWISEFKSCKKAKKAKKKSLKIKKSHILIIYISGYFSSGKYSFEYKDSPLFLHLFLARMELMSLSPNAHANCLQFNMFISSWLACRSSH